MGGLGEVSKPSTGGVHDVRSLTDGNGLTPRGPATPGHLSDLSRLRAEPAQPSGDLAAFARTSLPVAPAPENDLFAAGRHHLSPLTVHPESPVTNGGILVGGRHRALETPPVVSPQAPDKPAPLAPSTDLPRRVPQVPDAAAVVDPKLDLKQLVGKTLDREYFLETRFGAGADGSVFKATDKQGRTVAVKVMSEDIAMATEARALRTVDHPNNISVLAQGITAIKLPDRVDVCRYVVMPLANGGSLARYLAQHSDSEGVEPATVAAIVQKMGAGVGAAHKKNIVHGDLKPENLLLHQPTEDDPYELLVADYALATTVRPGAINVRTQPRGTPRYMAPRAFSGEVSKENDVYAAGIISYELATGRPPYTTYDWDELHWLHEQGNIPRFEDILPPNKLTDTRRALEAPIRRALSTSPRKRYQSITEFADDLAHVLRQVTGREPDLRIPVLPGTPFRDTTAGFATHLAHRPLSDEQRRYLPSGPVTQELPRITA